jgi:hypothetical protein
MNRNVRHRRRDVHLIHDVVRRLGNIESVQQEIPRFGIKVEFTGWERDLWTQVQDLRCVHFIMVLENVAEP